MELTASNSVILTDHKPFTHAMNSSVDKYTLRKNQISRAYFSILNKHLHIKAQQTTVADTLSCTLSN